MEGMIRCDHHALACIDGTLKMLDLLDLDIDNLLLLEGFESKLPSCSKPPVGKLGGPMLFGDSVGLIVHER